MAVSRKVYSGATDMRNRTVTVYTSRSLIVRFEMDRKGIARVAVGNELASATRQVVRERALPFAIRNSPRGKRGDDDGGGFRYVESFRVSTGYTVIAGMRRVAAKLTNIAPHAAAVEFTGSNPHASGYGVLRKTLAHLNGTGTTLREAKTPWREELRYRSPNGRFAKRPTQSASEELAEINERQRSTQQAYDDAYAALSAADRAAVDAVSRANMRAETQAAEDWRNAQRRGD